MNIRKYGIYAANVYRIKYGKYISIKRIKKSEFKYENIVPIIFYKIVIRDKAQLDIIMDSELWGKLLWEKL